MPFLDHLEELRWRILRSLGALVAACALGLWLVQRFQLVSILKQPIAPYLTNGKLVVTSPTDPVMIVFKLGFLVGLVLASPVILWQTWAFLAPALYEREKKALVPSLFVGLVLFLTGATLAYLYVVPQALRVLFSFQTEAIQPFITYDAYFGFVLQVVLALGLSFELPLVMIMLAWLGVVGPSELGRFRRYAMVGAFAAGAILSPGTDIVSMVMMTLPLLLLYEVGLAGAAVVHRRRRRAEIAAAVVVVLGIGWGATPAGAQVPVRRQGVPTQADSVRARTDSLRDSTRAKAGQPLDTTTAKRLGIPTAPSRSFPQPDSVITELLARPGYQQTRYMADSATVFVNEQRVLLQGEALTKRQESTLEADTITYQRNSCVLDAHGDPHLFDGDQVLVGQGIRYDTCRRRGIVEDALTNFSEGSTVWFLRGNVAQDSSTSRIFAGSSEITSCDLPTPHYHFAAGEMKWISRNVLVARPVVLYVRDVPILWLPFIFQDIRPGRRSGILVPQFGLNDLVRPTRTYNRQITNVGYYWAPNDYLDFTARLDWFANRYVQYGVAGQYRWLNRFISGSAAFNEQRQIDGASALTLRWDHRQEFNLTTSLNFSLNYASNNAVVRQNAIDPLQNTQQITSSLNYSKRFGWGTLTLGGNRRQSITDGSVQQLFPALTLSPSPIALGSDITWSPGLSFTNNTTSNDPLPTITRILPGGIVDTLSRTADTRVTAFNFDTPIRFGSFNWSNSVQVQDQTSTAPDSFGVRVPDLSTPDPNDSLLVSQLANGSFQSSIDWDTGINLPVLFRGSWKLQPVLGIANSTSGPFAIRNRATNGDFVHQGKRFRFGATASPTFFAFFPGIGPLSRIRHSVSPVITWNYQPAADIPIEFAQAISQNGQPVELRSDASQAVTVSLSQTFEGKKKPPAGDTASVTDVKTRLLSISTSPVTYDFEQAKKPGRSGWATQTITNSLLSDMLPGFNLSLTHDLFRGTAGSDTAKFAPFLQNVSASFAISGATFRAIGSIFGLGGKGSAGKKEQVPTSYVAQSGRRPRPGGFFSTTQAPLRPAGRSFSANFNYSLARTRPIPGVTTTTPDRQSLGFSTNFSPTPFWSLSWSSQYNITDNEFESQVVRLERDLHEWRASFNFVRNPNGNFAFYFSISLTDLPELKFDYDQTTFEN
jgi:Tat protein translocase TatC